MHRVDERNERMTFGVRTPRVSVHGRYLVAAPPAGAGPLLVGFHGYAENAETQLARLQSIPGADRFVLVSVQGLHRFYRGRSNDVVVASWMTRQDRELVIADNLAYVRTVLDEVAAAHGRARPPVFVGFSQGAAMAFRAAASGLRTAGVIALGGDVPPELGRSALAAVPAALVGRGARDDWYTAATFGEDVRRLTEAGVRVTPFEFDGAHEWTPAFAGAVAEFLAR
ncbi:MAG: alpha/beta hydrolase [Betaproteobacteria bacterium]